MTEYFEKVYIKTEDDLPKKNGRYLVHTKDNINEFDLHDSTVIGDLYNEAWLRTYDWYLRPIEQKPDRTEGLREELMKFIEYEGEHEFELHIPIESIVDQYLKQKGSPL